MSIRSKDQDFVIRDPEKQPGVIIEVPPSVKPIDLSDEGYLADVVAGAVTDEPHGELSWADTTGDIFLRINTAEDRQVLKHRQESVAACMPNVFGR